MVKIKYLNIDEMIDTYPAKAYYDIEKDEICIPSKELLFKAIYYHEYLHHLRRDKTTVKLLTGTNYILILLSATAVMTIAYSFMAYIAVVLILLLMVPYYYEEIYVQRKCLKELILNDPKKCIEETT